jgi:hypothetical protein
LEHLECSIEYQQVFGESGQARDDGHGGDQSDDEPNGDPCGHAGNANAAGGSGAFAAASQEVGDEGVVFQHEVEFDHVVDVERRPAHAGSFRLFVIEE